MENLWSKERDSNKHVFRAATQLYYIGEVIEEIPIE